MGEQNISKGLFWYADYFYLKTIKAKWLKKELDLLPDCLKEFRQRSCSRNRTMTRDIRKNYGQGYGGEILAGPSNESLLCGPGSMSGTEIIVLITFAFPSPWELLSYPFKSQTTTINIFFCFHTGLWPCWWVIPLSWVSFMHMLPY